MARIARHVSRMLLAGLLFGSWAPIAGAQDTPTLSIHGFGGWALGQTSNSNSYLDIASEDLAVNNHYFTLNLLAMPADRVSIHAQPTWQSNLKGQKLSIDLAYAEWEFADDTKLRAGKIRNPLGIYSEIFKVGTLRPFYTLPAGPYQGGPESYAGAGVNRRQRLGRWELELDVLGGQMDFGPSIIDRPVGQDPETHQPIFASLDVEREGRDFFGGGALVRPPVDGLEIGLTAYRMNVFAAPADQPLQSTGDEPTKALMASVEYLTGRLSLRAEALSVRGAIDFESGFAEAAFKIDDHWEVAAQYDFERRKDPVTVVESLGNHGAIGAAIDYWVNPFVVWKLNYYHVTDNRLARVPDAINAALAGQLETNTDVLIAGVHFAF